MHKPSALPPGFGFDPTELGASAARLRDTGPGVVEINDALFGDPADDRPVPTLWIGDGGQEEEDVSDGTPDRGPGSILITTICIGLALAAVAYVMDFPLS